MSDTKKLIERLRRFTGPWLGDGIQPAINRDEIMATIARLEAERDAARQLCATAYQVAGAAGASVELLDNLSAAVADTTKARREAMEECARMADEYATWGGSNFAAWFEKLAAAIRAAMP